MKKQYIVKESNKKKREEFYNYIKKTYKLKNCYPYFKKSFVNNSFPFVIDFEDNSFWICKSVTCCACAASQNVIYSINEFKELVLKREVI